MPGKSRKSTKPSDPAKSPMVSIPPDLLDHVVKGPMSPAQVHEPCLSLQKATIGRAMGAEMSRHLGYRPGEPKPSGRDNRRNGTPAQRALTDDGPVRVEVPRDREGSFDPILIPKHERRFTGSYDRIVAMYARGMTVREIQGFLAEQYGADVSPDLISTVTDEVMAEVTAWQARPLEAMSQFAIIFGERFTEARNRMTPRTHNH